LVTDATFWLVSTTKLSTAAAALQRVDKGLVSSDEDISRVMSELKTSVILKSQDENGQPILEKPGTEISLRSVYYIFSPAVANILLD
jgi:CubicO group peptidase (beta-lactamase class C family)